MKRNTPIYILALALLWAVAPVVKAQTLRLKTNLLHWATTTPNLGVEFSLHPQWSIDLWGAYNLIDFKGDTSLRHYLFQAEGRYWLRQTYRGHFVAVHALGGKFDVGSLSFVAAMKEHHYRGALAGGGITYGYQWQLSPQWGIEAAIGVGFIAMQYDKYRCRGCAVIEASYKRNYLGPTRAALSLVYKLAPKAKEKIILLPSPHLPAASPQLPPARHIATPAVVAPASTSTANTNAPASPGLNTRSGVMYIQYPQNETRVLPHFEQNWHELARIDSILQPLLKDSTVQIRSIRLTGYASPEGKYKFNVSLANHRIVEVMNYLNQAYLLPDKSVFSLSSVAEDWDGLTAIITASNCPYKEEVLEVIRTTPLFDGRELQLMKLQHGNPYRDMLQHVFPQLRRTEFVIEWQSTTSNPEVRSEPCP